MIFYSIDFHPEALADSDNAYDWYEAQQTGLGEKFLDKLQEKIGAIIRHPEVYSIKANGNYREGKVKGFPYTIVYKLYPKKKTIYVNAIQHFKANPLRRYRK